MTTYLCIHNSTSIGNLVDLCSTVGVDDYIELSDGLFANSQDYLLLRGTTRLCNVLKGWLINLRDWKNNPRQDAGPILANGDNNAILLSLLRVEDKLHVTCIDGLLTSVLKDCGLDFQDAFATCERARAAVDATFTTLRARL